MRIDELFFSPREAPKHMRVNPILHFYERDVWGAIKKRDIPACILYTKGYRSLGAKGTTTKASDLPAWEQDLESTIERSAKKSFWRSLRVWARVEVLVRGGCLIGWGRVLAMHGGTGKEL